MRYRAMFVAGLVLVPGAAQAKAPHYSATIARTTYGIPHIRAKDWGGLGYGAAYAYAQDNLCLLAEEFATVAGERSRFFGAKERAVLGFDPIDNLSSDLFFRATIDLPALRAGIRRQPPRTLALLRGYVAGYNRFLRDTREGDLPVACRGKPWLRPIGLDDMLRETEKQVLLASSLALALPIAGAAPPGAARAETSPVDILTPREGFGSNGWAFGRDVTADKRGLVVGNPHFPWNGPSRFYEMHLTIPGVYDVMGVGLAGTPIVALGFNRDVAWTHTVTAAQHFTVYQLTLDPADPTAYLVDGKREAMRRIDVRVPLAEGSATRTLYATRYGPVVVNPLAGLTWTKTQAFALRDANRGNQRAIETWLRIGQSRSVAGVRQAVSATLGIPWVNTIAADRAGAALHADVTAVPNVSAGLIADCATPLSAKLAARIVLLDGSRDACAWANAPGTPVAGLMPATDQAVLERGDYVANSNDSYWLSNPHAPQAVRSPILGPAATARTLRTRSGLVEIERRLSGTDGLPGRTIDAAAAKAMAFADRSLAAELAVDPLLRLCAGHDDLAPACAVLTRWDRRFALDSRGAYLFATFWDAVRTRADLWTTPFDVRDPVGTPRDLATAGAAGTALVAALKAAVAKLGMEGVALDARWGDVQHAERGTELIPIHGASGALGVLDVQQSLRGPGGLVPYHGTSYIQVVGFDAAGPVADALLSYSQSTDPASPHFADQTRAFSVEQWHRLPFSRAQIVADGGAATVTIRE